MEYKYNAKINIEQRTIGIHHPVYFIADIASNHDGDLTRALELIHKAKEAKAEAVKFQHFKAESIVSDAGFKHLGGKIAHQAQWNRSVFDTYKAYECNREWTERLIHEAQKIGIHIFTTPYDFEAVDLFEENTPAYKIGSGDITWIDLIAYIARKGKPVILSTGASDIHDVTRAVETILAYNPQIALLQCNTNYTGDLENFRHINLKVLQTYALIYPNMVLGLSDHSPGDTAALGAIALGARVIEKHFTDDNSREGPDHAFALNPRTWHTMVMRSREMEEALGNGIKAVEANEQEAFIVQRRCIRASRAMKAGERLEEKDLVYLRPAPHESIPPHEKHRILGRKIKHDLSKEHEIRYSDLMEEE